MKKLWKAILSSVIIFSVTFVTVVLVFHTEKPIFFPLSLVTAAADGISISSQTYLTRASKDPALLKGDVWGITLFGIAVFVDALRAFPAFSYVFFSAVVLFLVIDRRKKEKFGIIYDAITKKPVDLAVVRLLHADGRPFRTTVSDIAGRYAFFSEEGEYRIEVLKNGFKFPSRYEWGQRRDGRYLDLYHGELFRVGSEGAHITKDIPLAPVARKKSTREIFIDRARAVGARAFSIGVMIISALMLAIYRGLFELIVFTGVFVLYWVYRYGVPRVPKSWGIVFDKNTGKPIRNAVVRIFEGKYKKALDYRLTDAEGRYHFLAGNNIYLVTAEKAGYVTSDAVMIDLTSKRTRDSVISVDIGLAPGTISAIAMRAQSLSYVGSIIPPAPVHASTAGHIIPPPATVQTSAPPPSTPPTPLAVATPPASVIPPPTSPPPASA